MTELIGFDRAASFYDETRDLDPVARLKLTDVLAAEVLGKRCLEVGVGTGLVGLHLSRRGVPVTGLDLSTLMLRRLAGKFQSPNEVDLVQAEAAALPFRSSVFDAVVISQVLHLIEDWRTVLAESARVVRPSGVLLLDLGNDPDSGWGGPWRETSQKFWAYARPGGRRVPEVWQDGVVDAHLRMMGMTGRALPTVLATETLSVGDVIDRLDKGLWSACWSLPEDISHSAARRTREWAVARYGDVAERHTIRRTIAWRAYALPHKQAVYV